MAGQDALRKLLLSSIESRGYALDDVASVANGDWEAREVATGTTALVILRSFDLHEYVRGAAAFVGRLDADARDAWYRAFTRTSFLIGDPARIPDRLAGLFTHSTANVAWVWSPEDRATLGLRRLLKPLRTSRSPAAAPEGDYDLTEGASGNASGARKELCLATEGLVLEAYLVHLNHTLCESLITGALSPADRIWIRHVPEIEALPPGSAYVRVVPDPLDPTRLKAAGYVAAA
jgi:hypothetical protein